MFCHATWFRLTVLRMFSIEALQVLQKIAVLDQMRKCNQCFDFAGPSDKHEVGPKQQRDPGVGQSYSTASGQAHHARC